MVAPLLSSPGRRARRAARRSRAATETPSTGVNAVGYFDRTSGLGERGRVLLDVLAAGRVPVSEWPVSSTASPIATGCRAGVASDDDRYATTIALVTASELPRLFESHADILIDVDRVIGYWFWELAAIPDSHRVAIDAVDEIWTPTAFVRDAYRAVTDKPVHLVPLPIGRPQPAAVDRADVGLDHRFTFLVSFDHLSVMERKHPLGAIEAFARAFPAGDEPVRLLVKTLNGDVRPRQHGVLIRAAARDRRIDVVDAHTSAELHMALVAHADAYVSLHRSEGLGLQPAAAMWLGTPVIASRYSGTLDLMDDDSAELIDVELIPVRNAEGAYPYDAEWADPDLDQAAAAMRRLAGDPVRRADLATAALARRESDLDTAGAGRLVADLLAGRVAPTIPRRVASVGSVAPIRDDPIVANPPERADVRHVARAATAPVRNFFNQHFEMVKDEVRNHTGDRVFLVNLIHELESTVAETSLHQARTIARLREDSQALGARIADLERVIERLAEVVAAATLERSDDPR